MEALRALRISGAFVMIWMLAASTVVQASEIVRDSTPSTALGRPMPFAVYVPDGYAASRKRYPVLYLLHGAGGDENAWAQSGDIKARADSLIARGIIPPALIVMPGCPGCWWVDGARDKAETAFWTDLVPAISARYRTIEARRGRVIAGLSAGGYGALRYALKYADRIAAVAAFSPAVYSDAPPAISSARQQPPFLRADGTFDQDRWTQLNYPRLLPGYFNQPLRVPAYLVAGDNDRYGIAFETALLFKRLFDRQPDITELRVVDGDHSWDVWANAIERAMPFLFEHAALPEDEPASAPAVVRSESATIALKRR